MSPAQAIAIDSRRADSKGRIWPAQFGYDAWLVGITVCILSVGLVIMCSASTSMAEAVAGTPTYYLSRQLVTLLLATLIGMFVLHIPTRIWQEVSSAALVVSIIGLILVLIDGVGHEVNGSRRWIALGPISLQASEPAKLGMIIYLAGYLTRHGHQVATEFIGFIKPIGVLTLVSALLLLEPDFGSSAVIFAAGFGMLFLGGVPLPRFVMWAIAAFATLLSVACLAPYRLTRLIVFLDPWSQPYDGGFQLTQALIAFGRGEWFGVGLGNGIQKLFYLPEAHTDFVFAILGEELGLVGTTTVILLFTLLVCRILYIASIAKREGDDFACHLASGIALLIGIQAFVNMGVSMGVLPTKGLTLPLISYGSNSLLITCIGIAMVLRIGNDYHLVGSLDDRVSDRNEVAGEDEDGN